MVLNRWSPALTVCLYVPICNYTIMSWLALENSRRTFVLLRWVECRECWASPAQQALYYFGAGGVLPLRGGIGMRVGVSRPCRDAQRPKGEPGDASMCGVLQCATVCCSLPAMRGDGRIGRWAEGLQCMLAGCDCSTASCKHWGACSEVRAILVWSGLFGVM